MRLGPVAPDGGLRYTDWSNVPYLNRWDDDRQLKLNDNWADNRNVNWSSPSVRDCSLWISTNLPACARFPRRSNRAAGRFGWTCSGNLCRD